MSAMALMRFLKCGHDLGFSKMSSQKIKAVIAWRASVEAERALGF